MQSSSYSTNQNRQKNYIKKKEHEKASILTETETDLY